MSFFRDRLLQARVRASLLLSVAFLLCSGCSITTSLESQSPGNSHAVAIIENEGPAYIDRNFDLRVDGKSVFRSPDEGKKGTERIIWSQDGNRFLLVGKNFFYVDDAPKLPDGSVVYLLYDIRMAKVWCNSKQQNRIPAIPAPELAATAWAEPLASASPSAEDTRPR